jgi:hypothetical protein
MKLNKWNLRRTYLGNFNSIDQTSSKHVKGLKRYVQFNLGSDVMKLTTWSRVVLEKLTVVQLVKKFPALLWNPKVNYRTYNDTQLVTVQLNLIYMLAPY